MDAMGSRVQYSVMSRRHWGLLESSPRCCFLMHISWILKLPLSRGLKENWEKHSGVEIFPCGPKGPSFFTSTKEQKLKTESGTPTLTYRKSIQEIRMKGQDQLIFSAFQVNLIKMKFNC